ncbi:MAG: UDP-N-acetylmuramoyl-tripeptide--D-alanyl-D-alanine ligase [Muribaculaceae bacterium]|nr:UDP-N-acetylmuramoyl-tripeptide--D-alanyl-D-alanine ligase [Muribaculaceae bacterium]
MTIALYILALLTVTANLVMELRRDLMMFQQNSYRIDRYRKWLSESGDTTSVARMLGFATFFVALIPKVPHVAAMPLMGLFAIINTISLVRRKYKKPLVMTNRAMRIFAASLLCAALATSLTVSFMSAPGILGALFTASVTLIGCYCGSHLLIMLAAMLLSPWEKNINMQYINDARRRLEQMPDLKIIGITGSYGKTTTKHYLTRILSEHYETLMTPGSYNTTMGVVRTIREYLKPYHEVFVVEMGAKQPDDIAEICRLVHPQRGIITAVGPQHLESFKTIDNVQRTKFELADSLPATGLIVLNNDFEKIADRPVDNVPCLRYAVKNTENADYVAFDIKYSNAGTDFTVRRNSDGATLQLRTRLVGECNISNILGAVVMAQHMGVPDEKIRYAVEQLEQVEHRLSIKRVPGGLTIIDDAFNSNPVGSAMALDVLAAMDGKRILVTPGMVELGTEEFELNKEFGRKAASSCDVAIVVGAYNREAICSGLAEGGMPKQNIHTPDTFAQAQQLLRTIAGKGDTVLYENDLPDTFK